MVTADGVKIAYEAGGADRVDPADVRAMAEAHTSWQVAGPDRGREALPDEVWEAAVEMCRLVFERSWTGPRCTERHLTPPAASTSPRQATSLPWNARRRSRRRCRRSSRRSRRRRPANAPGSSDLTRNGPLIAAGKAR
ncbi:MAG TPA: hypothetical protein VFV66_09405 [Nonomuraea sp.]|nr:hypothetical protein [Nonomuraea sp.]